MKWVSHCNEHDWFWAGEGMERGVGRYDSRPVSLSPIAEFQAPRENGEPQEIMCMMYLDQMSYHGMEFLWLATGYGAIAYLGGLLANSGLHGSIAFSIRRYWHPGRAC